MTDLAPHLGAYLQKHLPDERQFSDHTIQSYTECFRLLVVYAAQRFSVQPCQLQIEHFDVPVVTDFLAHLEQQRNNSASTRNVRLAAIKSFFHYLEYRAPNCLELAMQIRAIPLKRTDKPLIDWLDRAEVQAILDAPSQHSLAGLRDRAMLHVCYAGALRVSELLALSLDSFPGAGLETVLILGKGRRMRELPLWKETAEVLERWLAVRPQTDSRHLFVSARRQPLSADGFAYILSQHVKVATESAPSLSDKRVTPHVLRHSSAMAILQATKDVRKVSLWLGHEHLKTTEVYLRASPMEKLEILDVNSPPPVKSGNFIGVKDDLMRVLKGN